MILYRVLRWTMSFYFRARMKIRFEGEENVPKKGPFFLVLSHPKRLGFAAPTHVLPPPHLHVGEEFGI